MKIFNICLAVFCMLASFPQARAAAPDKSALTADLEDGKTAQEKARNLVKTFRLGCFFNYWSQGKMLDWAATHFKELPATEAQAQAGLASVGAKQGRVFFGKFSEGEMEIVIEPDASCHLLGMGIDGRELHDRMKIFSDEIARNMKDRNVAYRRFAGDGGKPDVSQIAIVQTSPPVKTAIFASAANTGAPAQAVISIKNIPVRANSGEETDKPVGKAAGQAADLN